MSFENNFGAGNELLEQLNKIRNKAEFGDVTYDLNRWFRERMRDNDPEILEIQKQGFISEAKMWIKSTSPEKMKFGKATKEERLEKAREFAKKAKVSFEELVGECETESEGE